jgi:hypothetical protein
MNKILTIILLFITMISCSNDNNITISKEEYRKLKGDTTRSGYPKTFKVDEEEYIIAVGSDGHEYYSMYINVTGYIAHKRYFHYPGCIKCIKKDTL